MGTDHKANMGFEAEVRRVAEAIWDQPPGSCQPRHYSQDPVVTELDGLVRLSDVSHLLMVTTSSKLDKCREDVSKLAAAEKIERRNGAPAIAKWYITQPQLNAEHIEHCRKNGVTALTLQDFRRRFFDGARYQMLRQNSSFGSARNPQDNSVSIAPGAYVPLPMHVVQAQVTTKGISSPLREPLVDIRAIERKILEGKTVVLVGPFGAGKSLTTRELFARLSERNRSGEVAAIPVALNLREHWGQQFSDEILERHARSIGFTPKESLVIAWRAGMAALLLDGFDEVASQTVVRRDDKNFMRDARREALAGVRDFLTKAPSQIGVMICGRDHYFDSTPEMEHALGLQPGRYEVIKLEEFEESGAKTFLERNGIEHPLPDWLPRKPLFLAYLSQRGLFDDVVKIDTSSGFGFAWDRFLTLLTEREAQLERAVMDPATLRRVLERLAFFVRSKPNGTGPISGTDLSAVYGQETGQSAGEGVLAQLQRLPGLTQRDQDPGLRSFVDEDFLAALQGSAFARVAQELFEGEFPEPLDALPERAIEMAAFCLARDNATADSVVASAERIGRKFRRFRSDQLVADACAVAMQMAANAEKDRLDFNSLIISGAGFAKIDLESLEIVGLKIRDSVVREVSLGPTGAKSDLRFESCAIAKVSGAANRQGLPPSLISEDCSIDAFDSFATNSAVQQLSIAAELRALVTVLRKLYKQAGGGRKIAALHRGITRPDVAEHIDEVIEILQQEEFITIFNKIVHPVRRQASRVEKILSAPALSDDPLVLRVLAINSAPNAH